MKKNCSQNAQNGFSKEPERSGRQGKCALRHRSGHAGWEGSVEREVEVEMMRKSKHPIAVLGLPLDSLTASEAVDAIEGLILSGGMHQVATANLDFWLNSLADQHLHRIIAGCSLVLPDGMPLVWASGLLGCPLAERVTGVDLVPRLAELSARKGYGIFLLGGKGDVAERAAKLLGRNYPGVRIVGTYSPTEEHIARLDHSDILGRIHAAKPDILLVALGNPKQEKWIWIHRKRLGVPVAMGVGGSFEILVGDVQRAPKLIQRCGLEWLMRLMQEPSRLGPRYLRDFLGLARRLPMTLVSAWLQRPYLGKTYVMTARQAVGGNRAGTASGHQRHHRQRAGDGCALADHEAGDGGRTGDSDGCAEATAGQRAFTVAGGTEFQDAFAASCLVRTAAVRRVAACHRLWPIDGPGDYDSRPHGYK
jgi:N-acetylglucosaminyldiphosphoundecaprenol N-acetyl-beta-D-mannosaminyltransferase